MDGAVAPDGGPRPGVECTTPVIREATPETCSDGCSNDCDGLVDCDDPSCSGVGACPSLEDERACPGPRVSENTPETCSDGCSNDGDRFIDCDDRECYGVGSCPGLVFPPGHSTMLVLCPACGAENTPSACADGCSNDGDRWIDCNEPDCYGVGDCLAAPLGDAGVGDEPGCPTIGPENTVAACTDGCSNDEDAFVDCDDGDCRGIGPCAGSTGTACSGPVSYENTPEACSDGCSNDGDRFIDCGDWDCAGIGDCPMPEGGGPPPGCRSDLDCSDGVFCNGAERCRSDGTCGPPEASACGELECDEGNSHCVTVCDRDPDHDGDGHRSIDCGGDDCDDVRADIHPAAGETPGDGVDGDCDGMELCYRDGDGDGYRGADATTRSSSLDCSAAGLASLRAFPGDCDDGNAAVHPGAAERPDDGTDQDCDGLETCFLDADGDGHRPDATSTRPSTDLDCTDPGEARASTPADDCDDANAAIHPGATEVVGDGVDQDCNGGELCYRDADGDGYRPGTMTVASSDLDCTDMGEAGPSGPAATDCNDADAAIHPGVLEICNNRDDDCDGQVDRVRDGPGRPPPYVALTRRCGTTDVGACQYGTETCTAGVWGACTGAINPGDMMENCTNGIDDDCNGVVDGCAACTVPSTRRCGPVTDTGACTFGTQACTSMGAWGTCTGATLPTTESCNGMDDDCDGQTDEDEDAPGCTRYYADADGDRYPDRSDGGLCLCGPSGFYRFPQECVGPRPPGATCLLTPDDCDDSRADVNPGAGERCDATDHDCDGQAQEPDAEGCVTYYPDLDRDGYGDQDDPHCLCAPDPAYPRVVGGDCCDNDGRVHPGVTDWFTTANACVNRDYAFDYNCDGLWTRQRTAMCGGSVPACGAAGSFLETACIVSHQGCH